MNELVGFEDAFENGQAVNVLDVRWVGVPEAGARAAEGSGPNGGYAGWTDSEVDGG